MIPRLSVPFLRTFLASGIVLVCLLVLLRPATTTSEAPGLRDSIQQNADALVTRGRMIFRFDTFGDETFWGGQLRLNEAIASSLTPRTALAFGLKVDVDALPQQLVQRIRRGDIDLDSSTTTLALLRLNAVVGLKGFFD